MGFLHKVAFGLLLAVVLFVCNLIFYAGELHLLAHIVPTACTRVRENAKGFEDFAKITGGFAAASSDHSHLKFEFGMDMREQLRKKVAEGGAGGKLFFIKDNAPAPGADGSGGLGQQKAENDAKRITEMAIKQKPKQFFPHGIAGKPGKHKQPDVLLVVNHRTDKDTLELFKITDGGEFGVAKTATHWKTVDHDLLVNVNDCVISRNKNNIVDLYCTNWRSKPTGSLEDMAEVYGQMPWTNIVSCRVAWGDIMGSMTWMVKCEEVATGLKMANGVEVSQDGKTVVAVSSAGKEVIVYSVADTTNPLQNLTEVKRIDTRGACDNLMWADTEDGPRLLSGCHPKSLTFLHYSKDTETRFAPCEVVSIDVGIGETGPKRVYKDASKTSDAAKTIDLGVVVNPVKTLFLDSTGEIFSGCSVAAVAADGALFIGSVHDKGMMQCPKFAWSKHGVSQPQQMTRRLHNFRVVCLAWIAILLLWAPIAWSQSGSGKKAEVVAAPTPTPAETEKKKDK